MRSEQWRKRERQIEAICKLPAKDVASALTFVWGYLQGHEERASEGDRLASDVLNAIAARLGLLRCLSCGNPFYPRVPGSIACEECLRACEIKDGRP